MKPNRMKIDRMKIDRMFVRTFGRSKALALLGFAGAIVAVASCSEQLDSNAGCPLVCPQAQLPLRDTVIDGVVFDSSIAGFPPSGFETNLLLSARGDTFETRIIARFDTIPQTAHQSGVTVDSVITHVDSASLVLPLVTADSGIRPRNPFRINVYDVTEVNDTVTAKLLPLFRADKLIASAEFTSADSAFLHVPMPTDLIFARIQEGKPLRVGITISSGVSADLRVISSQVSSGPFLSLKVFKDSITPKLVVIPVSRFPSEPSFTAQAFGDFSIVAKGPPPPTPDVIRVGGVPWRRVYIRFSIPRAILDSSVIARATLLLTQRPDTSAPTAGDSVTVYALPILSSPLITDLTRTLEFAGPPGSFGLDSMRMTPGEGAVRRLEIGTLVRSWTGTDATVTQRAIALRIATEGAFSPGIDFYSMEALPSLRPRLRLTYNPRTTFGTP
jgi:hypothetical protein